MRLEALFAPFLLAACSAGGAVGVSPDSPADPSDATAEVGDDAGPSLDAAAETFSDATRPAARVLFDNTKGEQAGSADWVIDDSGRFPAPANPTKETDWAGGISAWGFALHVAGYELETLPRGARLTFGDATNDQDLSRYDVYVVPEPNNPFTASEATAMVAFVTAGGGLFLVADHGNSDRDNDGWDSPRAWNDVFDRTGDPFGVRFAADDITDSPDDNVVTDAASLVLHGTFGHLLATTYYNGSTMRVDATKNASVRALLWKRGAAQGLQLVTFATAELGMGRVAAIGDSSPADDGTGAGKLQNGWDDPKGTNRALFLNATAWLAHREE
jgi:hypothetical protein